MELAELDVPTAPCVVEAIRGAVDVECFGYPMFADTTLAEATASFVSRRYGWAADPAWVHDVPDVLRGVEIALAELGGDGDVVLPTPSYPPFFDVIALTGRRAVEVPMLDVDGRAALDLERIDARAGAGAGAVLLCNPQNPTGRAFERDELAALSEVVDRRGARVVADEVHAPLVYGRRHVPYASVDDAARGALGDGGGGVEGVEPGRAEVRPGGGDQRRRRATLASRSVGSARSAHRPSGSPRRSPRTTPARHGSTDCSGTSGRTAISWCGASPLRYRRHGSWRRKRRTSPGSTSATSASRRSRSSTSSPTPAWRCAPAATSGAGFGPWARLNFGTTTALLERGITAIAAAVPGGATTMG